MILQKQTNRNKPLQWGKLLSDQMIVLWLTWTPQSWPQLLGFALICAQVIPALDHIMFVLSYFRHSLLFSVFLKNATYKFVYGLFLEPERAERERKGDLDRYERLDGDRNQTTELLAIKKVDNVYLMSCQHDRILSEFIFHHL
jgi:hypothetical protein